MATPWASQAAHVAAQFGIPKGIFLALVHQESGFNPNAVSSAGARGLTQLMPATAKSLGVNIADPMSQLVGGAKYLKAQFDRFGNWKLALAAYNAGPGNVTDGAWQQIPETRNYVKSILGSVGKYGGIQSQAPVASPLAPPVGPTPQIPAPVLHGSAGLNVNAFASDELGHLGDPGFALNKMATGQYETPAPQLFSQKLTSLHAPQVPLPRGLTPSRQGLEGRVSVSTGANRPGVGLKPVVLDFVGRIAGVFGHPLTIGTGTNHNQYVAGEGHTQSEHWTGNAADIPAKGLTLTRLGQDALIAAGMPVARARAQRGGVFNLNVGGQRVQIIFNSHVGGNHFNHLHVGVH